MKLLMAGALGAAVMMSAGAASAGYKLDVTTTYQFGCPAGSVGYCGGPDTSFATFTNSGSSVFTGTISDVAVSGQGGGTDYSQSFSGLTLNPGDSFTFGTSPESSNVGGFNGPGGIELDINGFFGATPVSLSVDDMDIHSGVPNFSPCDNLTTDAFVLQGASPTGCDNGDTVEVAQAPGHFQFASAGGVPEPGAWAMMLLGMGALGGALRNRRRALAA